MKNLTKKQLDNYEKYRGEGGYYHIVYKIINTLNNKIYIGKHSCFDLNDGYMGSGKLIKNAIKSKGSYNFEKEILSFHKTSEEALKAENEYFTDEFLKSDRNYNIPITGGTQIKNFRNPLKFKNTTHFFRNVRNMKDLIKAIKENRFDQELPKPFKKNSDILREIKNKNIVLSFNKDYFVYIDDFDIICVYYRK